MSLHTYLLFIIASIVLCAVPGPDMVYLLGRTIGQGKKAGLVSAVGINVGAYIHLICAVLGVSAIIATSAVAFTLVKWCGAAYLFYLGLQALFAKTQTPSSTAPVKRSATLQSIFWQGVLIDLLNPKVALFYMALLPQFVQLQSGNVFIQLFVLGITLNVIALIINILLVLVAHWLADKFGKNQLAVSLLNKIMGGIFIGLGVRLANEHR